MSSVYGTVAGFTVPQISAFIAAIYLGGLTFQYPIGWLSDRMDRRKLIMASGFACSAAAFAGIVFAREPAILVPIAFVFGGISNPLYSLAIAYTNDMLQPEDMAAASAGLLFLNGLGAISGPILIGWVMGVVGPQGFWLFLTILGGALGLYAVWRTLRRPVTPGGDETHRYAPVPPTASPVAFGVAQEIYVEAAAGAEATKSEVEAETH